MTTTTSLIGNYRVIRLLGEGGMGLVYEAVRDDIGARAAIKVLRPEYARNVDIAARFINEARAVNMVQHPGVVRIFDYGQLPTGEAYLAMEYLEGDSLRARIMREQRLNETDTMRLGRQIALAVAAAHSKQIVHRGQFAPSRKQSKTFQKFSSATDHFWKDSIDFPHMPSVTSATISPMYLSTCYAYTTCRQVGPKISTSCVAGIA